MVISASLQACGVVFPFAMLTSICRSIVTICSGLYLLMGITRFSSKWILSHSTWYNFRRSRQGRVMGLIPFETKLARFRAVERHPSGKVVTEFIRQLKAAGVKKRARKYKAKAQRKRYRLLKSKTRLKALLKLAREAMGYRPFGGPKGRKSPEHIAALHAGRDRYWRAKREKNGSLK